MRRTCEVFIEVNLPMMHFNGLPIRKSENNVILSEGLNGVIEPKYFKIVSDKEGKVLIDQPIEALLVYDGTLRIIEEGKETSQIEPEGSIIACMLEIATKLSNRPFSILVTKDKLEDYSTEINKIDPKEKNLFRRILVNNQWEDCKFTATQQIII